MIDLGYYGTVAALFDYPDREYPDRVRFVLESLRGRDPKAAEYVELFLRQLPVDDLNEMQELFTRSFDVQSITTLDVGYVMFGDDYKRGELLSNLNREHIKAQNNCGVELADHLPNVLRLVSKLEDRALATELVTKIVFPALKRMIFEFSPERLETKKESYKKHYKTLIDVSERSETVYVNVLKALESLFRVDFVLNEKEEPKPTSDFLRSVVRELETERNA